MPVDCIRYKPLLPAIVLNIHGSIPVPITCFSANQFFGGNKFQTIFKVFLVIQSVKTGPSSPLIRLRCRKT